MIANINTAHASLVQPGYRLFNEQFCDVSEVNAGQIGVVGMPSDWTHSSRLGTKIGRAHV